MDKPVLFLRDEVDLKSLRGHFTTIFETTQVEKQPESSFALILAAPPEIAESLDDVRRRYDPAFKAGIPPHITVKRPAVLDNTAKIPPLREALREVVSQIRPLQVQLKGYGIFRAPGRNVVFLKVSDEQPFCNLHLNVIRTLANYFPKGMADHFEGEAYHPHLTIGNQLSDLDLAVLEHELATGGYRLDFSFTLAGMALCVNEGGAAWQVVEDFMFGTKSAAGVLEAGLNG